MVVFITTNTKRYSKFIIENSCYFSVSIFFYFIISSIVWLRVIETLVETNLIHLLHKKDDKSQKIGKA